MRKVKSETKASTNVSVAVVNAGIPELKSEAFLDMRLTKDDLIDLILEQSTATLEKELTDLENLIKTTSSAFFKAVKDELMKYEVIKQLEKAFKVTIDPTYVNLRCFHSENEVQVYVRVTALNMDVYFTVKQTKAITKLRTQHAKTEEELQNRFREVKDNLYDLRNNPKKAKRAFVREFLSKSPSGKSLLELVSSVDVPNLLKATQK